MIDATKIKTSVGKTPLELAISFYGDSNTPAAAKPKILETTKLLVEKGGCYDINNKTVEDKDSELYKYLSPKLDDLTNETPRSKLRGI